MLEINGVRGQIRIEVLHTQLEPLPDYGAMRWKVAVNAFDMVGQSDAIQILPATYESFLQKMIRLENERQGSASLTSASPEALQLRFQSLDRLGHMMVEGQIGSYVYVGGKSFVQKLIFGFELEPSTLPGIVNVLSAFKI
jgi:hypothetical protein